MDRGAWRATVLGVAEESDMTQQLNKQNKIKGKKKLGENISYKYEKGKLCCKHEKTGHPSRKGGRGLDHAVGTASFLLIASPCDLA